MWQADRANPLPGRKAMTPPTPVTSPRRATARGGWTIPILLFLAHYRAASVRTTVARFYGNTGIDPGWGLRVVHHLVDQGLIASSPIHPGLGRASQRVLTLTDKGWAYLEVRTPKRDKLRALYQVPWRDYWCQAAWVATERAAQGWTHAGAAKTFDLLRRAALLRYRGRATTDTDRAFRDRIERMPAVDIRLETLVHVDGSVRLLLPVREGRSVPGLLAHLPDLRLLAPLEVELVAAFPYDVPAAERSLKRWWSGRQPIAMHRLEPFVRLANPATMRASGLDRYRATLGKDVRTLLTRPKEQQHAPLGRVVAPGSPIRGHSRAAPL